MYINKTKKNITNNNMNKIVFPNFFADDYE